MENQVTAQSNGQQRRPSPGDGGGDEVGMSAGRSVGRAGRGGGGMPPSQGLMLAGAAPPPAPPTPAMNRVQALQSGPMEQQQPGAGGGLTNPMPGMPGSEGAGGVGMDPSAEMGSGDGEMDPSGSGMPMDPMMMARGQFQQLLEANQLLSEMYPAAKQFLDEASTKLVEGLLVVAESIQRPPQAPPVAV